MTKRALSVGINYAGTGYDLRGCLNDSSTIARILKGHGFDVDQVLEQEATTAGIRAGLGRLVKDAVPGDVLVFHYSGHGSQLPSTVEADGLDEILCPYDLNWRDKVITDDYLKAVFNSVPNGVAVTVILDCCHSGTALDQAATMKAIVYSNGGQLLDISEPTRERYLPPPAEIQAIIDGRSNLRAIRARDVDTSAVLVAMCAANQTSADAFIGGVYQGAGTWAFSKALDEGETTYTEVLGSMRRRLQNAGFTQKPELNGPVALYNCALFQPWEAIGDAPVTPAPVVVPPKKEKKRDNKVLIILGVLVAAFAVFILTR